MNFSQPGPFPLMDIIALSGLCLLCLIVFWIPFHPYKSAPNAAPGNRQVRERNE